MKEAACHCGSGKAYRHCCEPLHGGQPAANAEQLMRSRYTAYVLGLEAYLLLTWAESTRPATLDLPAVPACKWLGLQVRHHHQDAADHASVEFVARYRLAGRAYRLHETSRFQRDAAGNWRYLDGKLHTD